MQQRLSQMAEHHAELSASLEADVSGLAAEEAGVADRAAVIRRRENRPPPRRATTSAGEGRGRVPVVRCRTRVAGERPEGGAEAGAAAPRLLHRQQRRRGQSSPRLAGRWAAGSISWPACPPAPQASRAGARPPAAPPPRRLRLAPCRCRRVRPPALAELQEHEAEMEAVTARLRGLEAQAAALPADIADLRKREADRAAAHREGEAAAGREEEDVGYRLAELRRGTEAFAGLGLRFETQPDGKVRFVFTRIRAAAPDDEFSFTLQVHDDDSFSTLDCKPEVPDLADRMEVLNEGKDFSGFVRGMRRAFKAMV
ncbi:Spc25 [Symbiodinium sp. KB8]|nr:Spc25 [Symbiodinium sp. KB8]